MGQIGNLPHGPLAWASAGLKLHQQVHIQVEVLRNSLLVER